MKTKEAGDTAAATPVENAAEESAELTEEALARELMAEEVLADGHQEEAAGEEQAGEENANAEADGDGAPEGEAESEAETAEGASEAEGEANSEDDLSQAESAEGAEVDPDDAAAQAAIDAMPKATPEQKQHFHKVLSTRVGKLTKKLRTVEAELEPLRQTNEELQGKVAELEANGGPIAGMPAGENPLSNISTEAALAKKASEAQGIIRQVKSLLPRLHRQPEQVAAELKRLGVQLDDDTPEAMREFLETVQGNAEQTLQEHVPQQRERLQAFKGCNDTAEKIYPWLKNRTDVRTKKVNDLLQQRPHLARIPEGRWLLTAAVDNAARMAQEAAKTAKPPLAQKPPVKPKPQLVARKGLTTKPPVGKGESAALIAARKRFEEDGSQKNLEALEALGG